jgi:hypothetical protein
VLPKAYPRQQQRDRQYAAFGESGGTIWWPGLLNNVHVGASHGGIYDMANALSTNMLKITLPTVHANIVSVCRSFMMVTPGFASQLPLLRRNLYSGL